MAPLIDSVAQLGHALQLLPSGLQGPTIPAPMMPTGFLDAFSALHALGLVGPSGASLVLSTGSTRKAALKRALPAPQEGADGASKAPHVAC